MLTKKDFKAIADILNNLVYDEQGQKNYNHKQIEYLINSFSEYLKTKNPNFDEVKFKEAVLK